MIDPIEGSVGRQDCGVGSGRCDGGRGIDGEKRRGEEAEGKGAEPKTGSARAGASRGRTGPEPRSNRTRDPELHFIPSRDPVPGPYSIPLMFRSTDFQTLSRMFPHFHNQFLNFSSPRTFPSTHPYFPQLLPFRLSYAGRRLATQRLHLRVPLRSPPMFFTCLGISSPSPSGSPSVCLGHSVVFVVLSIVALAVTGTGSAAALLLWRQRRKAKDSCQF